MEEIYITDLVEEHLLQKVQNSFSKLTGVASLITDINGVAVTKGTLFSDFCGKYTRKNEMGRERCEQCNRIGLQSSLLNGKPAVFQCHAGVYEIAFPILLYGDVIGCIFAGQVLKEEPNKDLVISVARDLGINPEAYWEAAKKLPVISQERMEILSDVLRDTADLISSIAREKYLAKVASKEVERAAQMKTDFLANMSHEIRTPMNAVIGLAEVAMREELSPVARDCLAQIKSSGNALLNIINDILDFSKIESGKMNIVPVEYEPLSLFHDTINIVMTRLKDKNVELLLSVNPNLPAGLYGDNLRVRQVLINIANNAAKFTKRGKVAIVVDYTPLDETHIDLQISVQDTGIGIKEEDLSSLFQSFQQVDSKRNRNVEGTGLGLAITKQLLSLMGGEIGVTSVYEKGSNFYFHLPQEVTDPSPCLQVKDAEKKAAIGYLSNAHLAREFYSDTDRLKVLSAALPALDRLECSLEVYHDKFLGKKLFFFVDEFYYDEEMKKVVDSYPEITFILLTGFYSTRKSNKPNLRVVCKPLSTMHIAMALNDKNVHVGEVKESFEFDFQAPTAEILIVDDNEINLTVAEGLLEPLKMKITKATSGKMALDLIAKNKYDIIFMDHMMPEMDGVDTTRIIRRLHPSYNDTPIIALTANAVGDVKNMFIQEGMNDFVAKPIEIRTIVKTIKKWLPKDKIVKSNATVIEEPGAGSSEIIVGDLDTAMAIQLLGNEKLFWYILEEYYNKIEEKSVKIKEFELRGDVKNYTIEVHALKSSSKQIGAVKLSEMAARLEQAGNAQDIKTIALETDAMLQKYTDYIDVLKPYFEKGEKEFKMATEEKTGIDTEDLLLLFDRMLAAVDELDLDRMEELMVEMEKYSYPEEQLPLFQELQVAVGNIDVDSCTELLEKWKNLL